MQINNYHYCLVLTCIHIVTSITVEKCSPFDAHAITRNQETSPGAILLLLTETSNRLLHRNHGCYTEKMIRLSRDQIV